MVDFDALEAAGIVDARRRAPLIEYLDGLGFTAEEMIEAERHGRLFGLAGDALQRSGPPIHSLRTAADALGVALDAVAHLWSIFGLTVSGPDQVVLSQADLDALQTCFAMRASMDDAAADGLLRVIGSLMARLAEAESAVVRAGRPDLWIGYSHDELATAQTYRAVALLIPRIGALIDAVHRHHMVGARTYFEGVIRSPTEHAECGIGFADLSGFTALTQVLTPVELSKLLKEINATVTDVVHADGGRMVKFIGDEVMWVSSTPAQLVATATDLVNHPRARDAGLRVRAGLAYGSVLAINGDYFGNPVNLAARLVAAAAPGQILATAEVREALPDRPAIVQEPLMLKGFERPATAYDMSPAADG
jgi:class 3 adenylate cyclase